MARQAANKGSYPFSAPGTAYPSTPALKFRVHSPGKLQAQILNLGKGQYNPASESNDLTMKIQVSSDDGVLDPYTDVNPDGAVGPDVTVVPEGEEWANWSIGPEQYVRVLAYGNAYGQLETSWGGKDELQLMEF